MLHQQGEDSTLSYEDISGKALEPQKLEQNSFLEVVLLTKQKPPDNNVENHPVTYLELAKKERSIFVRAKNMLFLRYIYTYCMLVMIVFLRFLIDFILFCRF